MNISILISSYNKGKYIKDCIESCLSQNYNNFEVILSDNYSTDETDEILSKYKHKIKIFKNKKISNFSAINQIDQLVKAFKHSNGEIVCLLDADDIFDSKKIVEVSNFFTNNKSIDTLFDLPMIKVNELYKKFENKPKMQNKIWPTIIPSSSISMKRSFFEECISVGLFSNYNILEIDFRINVYARIIKNNFKILNTHLNVYRQVDDSIMSSHRKYSKFWWQKRLQAHQFMKEWIEKNNQSYSTVDYLITKIIVSIFNLNKLFK